jgi:delta8-fatty-acid desaturase
MMGCSQTKMPSFSRADIDKMIANGKIIFLLENRIIDATDQLASHPGGDTILRQYNGRQSRKEYDFHSSTAKIVWQKRIVGILEDKIDNK